MSRRTIHGVMARRRSNRRSIWFPARAAYHRNNTAAATEMTRANTRDRDYVMPVRNNGEERSMTRRADGLPLSPSYRQDQIKQATPTSLA
jgi:type IV secretory pathway VirB9-like protein